MIDELGDGAMLIGGLAATAWIGAGNIGLVPLLQEHGFESLGGDAQFRFVKTTAAGEFLVDLLVAPGSSRADPPILEADLTTLAAPGLAYAILRRPQSLSLTITYEKRTRRFKLPIVALDSAFVMKAVLTAGRRLRPARRISDTTDAVMLAAACTNDKTAMASLHEHRRRTDVRDAIHWMTTSFETEKTAAARRVERHFEFELGQSGGGAWAVDVSHRFRGSLP